MILLRILTTEKTTIEQIARYLLEENFVIDVNLKDEIRRAKLTDEGFVSEKIYLLTAKTRSVMFQKIESILTQKFPEKEMELYSIPIVHMDWSGVEELTNQINSHTITTNEPTT